MLRQPTTVAYHPWRFFRTGGLVQVALESAEDLLALPNLDEKLWVALSCPVKGLEIDQRTLELVDSDHDGHIHVCEVLQAVEWATTRLKHPANLLKGEAALPLDGFNDTVPPDRALIATAKEILKRLGKPDAASLAVEDFKNLEKLFPPTALNGDGVIAPSETEDAELQALIKDVLTHVGGEKGRDGNDGITPDNAEAFYKELTAYLDSASKSATLDIAVLGERTAAACTALAAVRAKIDDFFSRCQLAAFDPRALGALHRQETDVLANAAKDLVVTGDEIAAFPLARATPEAVLPLDSGLNPAWLGAMAAFRRDTVVPMFGADKRAITADEWKTINERLAPYETWLGKNVGASIERLGIDRAKAILNGGAREKLNQLFVADKKLQPEHEALAAVERLVHYYRDLATLLRNFVNFSDFYSRDRWAAFQAGKLYLDSRACELCIRVDDPNTHAGLATMSKAYIAYLDCQRGKDTMKIAACFTQGDSDYLFVGRNGLFYDRQGNDWHATITKIIENPISLREAFWAPYKKVIRTIEEQIAKRAAAAETTSVANLTTAATAAPGAPAVPSPATKPGAGKLDLSSIIGLSVALGSIGTFLATVFAKFVDLAIWEWPLVVVAAMLAVSLPSVLITWMKLRQRNLGPILEANGWAINGRVKINVPFGTALTERAKLPPKSHVEAGDPYSSEHPVRTRVIVYSVLLVLAAAVLIVARIEHTWPFAPAAEEKASLKQFLVKPIATPSTAAPAKK